MNKRTSKTWTAPHARSWFLPLDDKAELGAILGLQAATLLKDFEQALSLLKKAGMHGCSDADNLASARLIVKAPAAGKEWVLTHPCFGFWTHLATVLVREVPDPKSPVWPRVFGFMRCLAASVAVTARKSLKVTLLADINGRVHFSGLGAYLDFGAACAEKEVRLTIAPASVSASFGKTRVTFTTQLLRKERSKGETRSLGKGVSLVFIDRLPGGIEINDVDPMIREAIREHGIAEPGDRTVFVSTLADAITQMKETAPGVASELARFIRVIVPLTAPRPDVSVSSTYRELPGALALSHYQDVLVQAETLIHEYHHNKLNAVMGHSPIIACEDKFQYYSPLKDNPRQLAGILLAAHAFGNVATYYLDYLDRHAADFDELALEETQSMLARRIFQVELETNAISQEAELTAFGSEFLLEGFTALGGLMERIKAFKPGTLKDAWEFVDAHRRKFSAYPTFRFKKKAASGVAAGR